MIVMTGENIRKISTTIFIVIMCVALLSAQSLVEIAKKEKERRTALRAKGIKSIVVTNAELKRPKRLPMVTVQSQVSSPQGSTPPRQRTTPRPSNQTTSQQKTSKAIQSRDVYGYRKNATKVLFSTELIENPDFALNKPDGQYAEMSIPGVLELEFSATNGPGADIAIYARLAGAQEMMRGDAEDEGAPIELFILDYKEGFWYGVFIMKENGEWEAIGKGTGRSSPDEFDLGRVQSISRIRIMFKPHANADFPAKFNRIHSGESTFGIDAVEALH
jgi:hypothetical protein